MISVFFAKKTRFWHTLVGLVSEDIEYMTSTRAQLIKLYKVSYSDLGSVLFLYFFLFLNMQIWLMSSFLSVSLHSSETLSSGAHLRLILPCHNPHHHHDVSQEIPWSWSILNPDVHSKSWQIRMANQCYIWSNTNIFTVNPLNPHPRMRGPRYFTGLVCRYYRNLRMKHPHNILK